MTEYLILTNNCLSASSHNNRSGVLLIPPYVCWIRIFRNVAGRCILLRVYGFLENHTTREQVGERLQIWACPTFTNYNAALVQHQASCHAAFNGVPCAAEEVQG